MRTEFDKLYGLDVLLNNGKKYFPDSNPVTGHPFWRSDKPFLADLTIHGKTFPNESLRYNIFKQEFVLLYTNLNGQKDQIILNSEGIDSVRIDDILIVPNTYPEIKQKFIQQIYNGQLISFVGWYKELQFNRTGVNIGYMYLKDNHVNYLIHQGVVHRFSGRSSFLSIFSGYKRALIRKYLSSKHIRFKKMETNDLKDLLRYCEKTVF
ncbi:MAG: hypothetical protein WAO52_05030 [Prolixibacteraceae bacterium]